MFELIETYEENGTDYEVWKHDCGKTYTVLAGGPPGICTCDVKEAT
jgi:hypothetical protein